MAKSRMDLPVFVGKFLQERDRDVLREGVRVLAQALMEAEVTELVGAERHERTDKRTGYRNGSRTMSWDTRVGTIELGAAVRSSARPDVPLFVAHRHRLADAHAALDAAIAGTYRWPAEIITDDEGLCGSAGAERPRTSAGSIGQTTRCERPTPSATSSWTPRSWRSAASPACAPCSPRTATSIGSRDCRPSSFPAESHLRARPKTIRLLHSSLRTFDAGEVHPRSARRLRL